MFISLIWFSDDLYKNGIFDNNDNEIDNNIFRKRTTLINLEKYKLVMFAMTKIMEMETIEQNKVALYLFNNISIG